MGAHAILNVRVPIRGMTADELSDRIDEKDSDKVTLVQFVRDMIDTAIYRDGGGLVCRAEGVTTSDEYGEFTCVRADVTTGDVINVKLPDGLPAHKLTAVASGPTAASGEWTRGANDAAMATSIVAAINAYPPFRNWITATANSDSVRITAVQDSQTSASIKLWETVTTSTATSLTTTPTRLGSLTNGVLNTTLMPSKSITVTIGSAPTANDTLRFGNVLLTWKASAANENEVTLNANTTTSAANLVTKVNAHSILGKLVVATNVDNVVTLAWANSDLLAYMTYCVAAGSTPGTISGQFQTSGLTSTLSADDVAFATL